MMQWILVFVLHHCHPLSTHIHIHNHFTALWTLSGTTRVSWYRKVRFAIFWIFWCRMKITQADAPTIWMDCHPIQTNWCPYLCHPHHFYAGCPSWHNPPNLSWLGTGTKCAGLHTWWLGLASLSIKIHLLVFMRDSIYAIARICHRNSVCLSVRLSHGWISQKRLKLGLCSFHHTVAPSL